MGGSTKARLVSDMMIGVEEHDGFVCFVPLFDGGECDSDARRSAATSWLDNDLLGRNIWQLLSNFFGVRCLSYKIDSTAQFLGTGDGILE